MASIPEQKTDRPIYFQAVVLAFSRLVLNGNLRMLYPFLPVFARGLGVSITDLSLAVTARAFMGSLNPIMAAMGERQARKTSMLTGIGLFIAAMLLVVIWPTYPAFFAAMLVSMIGMFILIFSIQAHLGDRVPYQQRGRILAVTEMGWSFSFILLVPLIGFLIDQYGWQAPFPLLAGLGAVAFILVLIFIPSTAQESAAVAGAWRSIGGILTSRTALAAVGMGLFLSIANEVVNLMFGVWMEDSFQLQVAALGAASVVIGVSELSGEVLTAGLVDRLGKERAIAIGLGLNALFALALPLFGRSVPGALVGLFCFYITFEFAMVSSLPLLTEIHPKARATLMGTNMMFIGMGRAVGAFLAPRLYAWDFWANVLAAAIFNLVAIFLLSRIRIQKTELQADAAVDALVE
jgi:predicted MFS family arabinose efflux permease